MRTALRGVLPVDERKIVLPVLVQMGEGHLDVVALEVYDRIEGFLGKVFLQQVLEAFLGTKGLSVVLESKTLVQKRIVADHPLDVLVAEPVLPEHVGIGSEGNAGPVHLGRLLVLAILGHDVAALELDPTSLAIAKSLNVEVVRKRIDRLYAHPIEPDGLLEGLRVVLGSRIDLRGASHQFLQWNAATVVAHDYGLAIAFDLDGLAETHDELVDAVVDDLLEQDVNPIVLGGTVPQLANVHAGTKPDVLLPVQ